MGLRHIVNIVEGINRIRFHVHHHPAGIRQHFHHHVMELGFPVRRNVAIRRTFLNHRMQNNVFSPAYGFYLQTNMYVLILVYAHRIERHTVIDLFIRSGQHLLLKVAVVRKLQLGAIQYNRRYRIDAIMGTAFNTFFRVIRVSVTRKIHLILNQRNRIAQTFVNRIHYAVHSGARSARGSREMFHQRTELILFRRCRIEVRQIFDLFLNLGLFDGRTVHFRKPKLHRMLAVSRRVPTFRFKETLRINFARLQTVRKRQRQRLNRTAVKRITEFAGLHLIAGILNRQTDIQEAGRRERIAQPRQIDRVIVIRISEKRNVVDIEQIVRVIFRRCIEHTDLDVERVAHIFRQFPHEQPLPQGFGHRVDLPANLPLAISLTGRQTENTDIHRTVSVRLIKIPNRYIVVMTSSRIDFFENQTIRTIQLRSQTHIRIIAKQALPDCRSTGFLRRREIQQLVVQNIFRCRDIPQIVMDIVRTCLKAFAQIRITLSRNPTAYQRQQQYQYRPFHNRLCFMFS